MATFVVCSQPENNYPVNIDWCTSLEYQTAEYGKVKIFFHGCSVEWLYKGDCANEDMLNDFNYIIKKGKGTEMF